MSTETITRQWRAGAVLSQKVNAEVSSGRATRPACEIERCLVVCRQCDAFKADQCARLEHYPDGFQATGDGDHVSPTFAELLTRVELLCRLWLIADANRGCRRRSFAATERALSDIHTMGTHRNQDEYRAARRDARSRRRKARE